MELEQEGKGGERERREGEEKGEEEKEEGGEGKGRRKRRRGEGKEVVYLERELSIPLVTIYHLIRAVSRESQCHEILSLQFRHYNLTANLGHVVMSVQG